MIDETLPAAATRFAQEDPAVPVLAVGEARRAQPGGAANVAANLVAMGCRARLFTSAHSDPDGLAALRGLAAEYGFDLDVTETRRPGRVTTKTRVTVGGRLAARIDRDPVGPLDPARPPADPAEAPAALVFCDHAKGAVGAAEDMAAWRAASGVGVAHVWLDPHPSRWAAYARLPPAFCTVVPNRDEAAALTGVPVDCSSEDAVRAAAGVVAQAVRGWANNVHLKLGPYGSVVYTFGYLAPVDVTPPAHVAAVYDLQGAGDTFLAAAVAGQVVRGYAVSEVGVYANAAASVAVGRPGTAVVRAAEVADALRPTLCGPVPWEDWVRPGAQDPSPLVVGAAAAVRRAGLKVGFTNGCFDVGLHPGHIRLLHRASELCDFLVVGVDSDERVAKLKGPGRPVVTARDRAAQVAVVRGVGGVLVFDREPADMVQQIRPAVMFKGEDYRGRPVSGSELLPQWGGELVLIPMFEGHSTTARVARVRGE
jgi:D-beta-D-heptose 7-phosphate kinase/D-beta-D-heptose 1-phosphate adenosyltransferase